MAHLGQYRRDGITPYVSHPEAVASRLSDLLPEYQATAWLHDVLEDTKATELEMRDAGIPDSVIAEVRRLTHLPGEDYAEYLKRVKESDVARQVKIADMLHNLSANPTDRQISKYSRGLLFLLGKDKDTMTLRAENERLKARVAELEGAIIERIKAETAQSSFDADHKLAVALGRSVEECDGLYAAALESQERLEETEAKLRNLVAATEAKG